MHLAVSLFFFKTKLHIKNKSAHSVIFLFWSPLRPVRQQWISGHESHPQKVLPETGTKHLNHLGEPWSGPRAYTRQAHFLPRLSINHGYGTVRAGLDAELKSSEYRAHKVGNTAQPLQRLSFPPLLPSLESAILQALCSSSSGPVIQTQECARALASRISLPKGHQQNPDLTRKLEMNWGYVQWLKRK